MTFSLRRSALSAALACIAATATAQQRDTTKQSMAGMDMGATMLMEGPLGISMERMGSGTTWIPDAVSLPSRHFMLGSWNMMLHGFAFAQYDRQGGPRGGDQFGSLNWAMLMADHSLAGGRLQLRFMPSLDALTVGKCGYPLLLQSGETCNGQPLVDRQHPHDFFMELGALYERAIGSRVGAMVYAAPAGEPALGPVAFMHRPSAMDVPFAPLSHHWQDATHISFGVVTAGVFTRTVRVEASAFNGLEPDENRWDFDSIKLNSYSARVTVNPSPNWSFTSGYGAILHPEPGNAKELQHRLVFSALNGRAIGSTGQWATSVIVGANKQETWSTSVLAETQAVLDTRNTVFGRAELVQKSAEDLSLPAFAPDRRFSVGAGAIGYIRELTHGTSTTIGLGASATLNVLPSVIESSYGGRTQVGATLFVRLRACGNLCASRHSMPGMEGHHGH